MLWRWTVAKKERKTIREGTKARLVRRILEGTMTPAQAAKEAEVSERAVRGWLASFRTASVMRSLMGVESRPDPSGPPPEPSPRPEPAPAPKVEEKLAPPKPAPHPPAPVKPSAAPAPRRRDL